jgi:hypothetical protein
MVPLEINNLKSLIILTAIWILDGVEKQLQKAAH